MAGLSVLKESNFTLPFSISITIYEAHIFTHFFITIIKNNV